jgi:guanine deaminase
MNLKIIKGHIIYTKEKTQFEVLKDSFIVVNNKKVVDIYNKLPDMYIDVPIIDYGDSIIIPSFIDLHIHAPQYMQMGIGLDLELIDWLNKYTFRNEEKFSDIDYARQVYPHFVKALYDNGTLRSCIFATIHNDSTYVLIEELKQRGLSAYVGKVNMNKNAPDKLIQTTDCSIRETREFIESNSFSQLIKPIITPRFAPSCSSELLKKLGEISCEHNIPVQTHLSENKKEVEWVESLFPKNPNYSDVYREYNLYGREKTLMAHSIYLSEAEIEMAKQDNIFLVHCPNSNMNLTSGIMPLTNFLDKGIKVGLGSDVGAGHKIGMQHTITSAIQCSKINHIINEKERLLSESEAFYLATKLNGSFFGKVGSFEKDYYFDALVINSGDKLINDLTPLERLQKFLYCGDSSNIIDRYLEGQLL